MPRITCFAEAQFSVERNESQETLVAVESFVRLGQGSAQQGHEKKLTDTAQLAHA